MDALEKWKKEIVEISSSVWTVTMTHVLGAKIEKTGENLEELEKEVKKAAIHMNQQIEAKIKSHVNAQKSP